jgi:hypothetical protein
MREIAGIAQLVERNLAKVEVASSRLVSRSSLKKESVSAFLFCFLCPVPVSAGISAIIPVFDIVKDQG